MVPGRGGVEDTSLKAEDTKKSEAKDRHSRGQGQECSRPRTQAQVLSKQKKTIFKKTKKKVFTKIFQAISTKKRFPKNFSWAPQNFNNSKIVLSSSRGHANFRGLEASRPRPRTWPSRPRPRTSKSVLEAKDVLKDSTSGTRYWHIWNCHTIPVCSVTRKTCAWTVNVHTNVYWGEEA